MEKFYEKKNLGVPVTILVFLTYFIGYSLTRSLSGTLFVAIVFAGAVFSLQFDDRVKNAVKHSYIFAAFVQLIYFVFNIFEAFISMLYGGRVPSMSSFQDGFYGFGFLPRVFTFLYTYGLILVNIAVIVVFAFFFVMTLLKKDVNIGFVSSILGDAPPKQKQQPTYNQQHAVPPVAPYNQAPVAPQAPFAQPQTPVAPQAPIAPVAPPQAPVAPSQAPAQQVSGGCSKCGHVNVNGAVFCASCGNKL